MFLQSLINFSLVENSVDNRNKMITNEFQYSDVLCYFKNAVSLESVDEYYQKVPNVKIINKFVHVSKVTLK